MDIKVLSKTRRGIAMIAASNAATHDPVQRKEKKSSRRRRNVHTPR